MGGPNCRWSNWSKCWASSGCYTICRRANGRHHPGTSADEDGYIGMEHEGTPPEAPSIAQAVHNAGGTVICQVKRIVKRGSVHPQMVEDSRIPDRSCRGRSRADADLRHRARPGPLRRDARAGGDDHADPLTERRVIARRAAFELRPRDVVNLGVGISAMIPNVAAEEGIEDMITLTVEAGVIGGVPGHGREFGTAINPRAILDQAYQFDFYDGGGLTCAFLSFAEVDEAGNVNVTRFGDRRDGSGGFIDITQNARRLIFNGTLVGGKFDIGVENGRLIIRRDGAFQKFVPRVGQISFSAELARAARPAGVLRHRARRVPARERRRHPDRDRAGVRLEEDVLAHIGFRPRISPELREMDPRIFRPGPMGIGQNFCRNRPRARRKAAPGSGAMTGPAPHRSICISRISNSAPGSKARRTS